LDLSRYNPTYDVNLRGCWLTYVIDLSRSWMNQPKAKASLPTWLAGYTFLGPPSRPVTLNLTWGCPFEIHFYYEYQ